MSPSIASTTTVDREGLMAFVSERRQWVLSTVRGDGRPQMSPVTGSVLADGTLAVATYPMRDKVVNIRRNGLVSVCVQSDDFGGSWVQVDGTAVIVDLPEAMDGLVEYYRAASGEHPDWNEYRDAMTRQEKCLIKLRVERWGPVAKGGFPPSLKSLENWQPSVPAKTQPAVENLHELAAEPTASPDPSGSGPAMFDD